MLRGFLLLTVTVCAASENASFPPFITIGAVLTSKQHGETLQMAVDALNAQRRYAPPMVNSTYILMSDNPIRSAKAVCDELIPRQVYVVITSHTQRNSLSPMAVSFTCGFYRIPVIGITTRESIFSDENVHVSFIRTVPPYSDQARVWVDLLKHFSFKKIIFIHSSDQEGRAILNHFQISAEKNESQIVIEKSIQYTSGQPNFTDELSVISDLDSRVILLYASPEDAEPIYRDATHLNLTVAGFVWIATEQALVPRNTPIGTIGLKLQNSHNEGAHIDDSVTIIGKALALMLQSEEKILPAPKQCTASGSQWQSGHAFLRAMVKSEFIEGKTGHVAFDDLGDRLHAAYDVVNVQSSGEVTIGAYASDSLTKPQMLTVQNKTIVWPGGATQQPRGIKISHHLKVVTINSIPFVFVEKTPGGKCAGHDVVPCPHFNSSSGHHETLYCCGYAIDLLMRLANQSHFQYDVHLVEDGLHGTLEPFNNTKRWNGMIGELLEDKADLIVAPLTINQERADVIDFSKPFKYQGLTILVKKKTRDSSLNSFLQPFHNTLWILVALSVHVVGLVLYLLDRFSPFGRFKLAKNNDTEEDALNLSSAMWFAWGVLLNSGIGEGTPRSFSARVLGMVWAGFAMIIVASYTANLAAFLVLDRPEATISGIDDARLRNPQKEFVFATVKNSAVSMYFKRQVELSTMFRTMETNNLDTPEQAIAAIKNDKLNAFIWDSSRLEYEVARDDKCELMTAGELFGRSGYGIGLKKNSPWTHNISQQILMFHEGGHMESLDSTWIQNAEKKCPEKTSSPATLGLQNMAGVFMMVAGGIVAGVFLILVEIAYKRHCSMKEKKMQLVKRAADRWRGNIEKRKMLRQSRQYLRSEKMASNSNGPDDPLLTSVGRASPLTMGPGYEGKSAASDLADNMRFAV